MTPAEQGYPRTPSAYVYDLWDRATCGGLTKGMIRRLLLTPRQEREVRHLWYVAQALCETCRQIEPWGYHTVCGRWYLRMHGTQAFVYFYSKPQEVTYEATKVL